MNPTLIRGLMAFACLLLAVATALAAVASHALGARLDPQALQSFETAVEFQFIHALGLMALAAYGQRAARSRLWPIAAWLLVIGIALFCGGVYASSLGGPRPITALAPAGGIALMAGWVVAASGAWIARPGDRTS